MNETTGRTMAKILADSGKFRALHALKIVSHRAGWGCLLISTLLAVGCSSRSLTNAPVEDRGTGVSRPGTVAAASVKPPMPGAENAGKPGYYTVKPGDAVIRIGLENGQNWRDIARWNNLTPPYTIEIGQVLRVVPPVNNDPVVVARPVTPGSAAATAGTDGAAAASAARPSPAPAVSAAPSAGEDDIAWIWPAQGTLVAGFDEAKNKGLDIAGKAGDAVIAAADGRVVYAGAGLRGYGNLIILKHNNTFLTAYAHNQTLLIKEDQSVKKGQKIAEMGNSDADRVKLHFEIRRQGKPVDPAKYLPAR
jgi:lipoprotein NlpD